MYCNENVKKSSLHLNAGLITHVKCLSGCIESVGFVCFSFVTRALYPLKICLGNLLGQDFSEPN